MCKTKPGHNIILLWIFIEKYVPWCSKISENKEKYCSGGDAHVGRKYTSWFVYGVFLLQWILFFKTVCKKFYFKGMLDKIPKLVAGKKGTLLFPFLSLNRINRLFKNLL